MTNSASWLSIDPAAPGAIEDLCADLARSPLAEHVDLFTDPRWVAALADQDEKRARIYVLREHDCLTGLATFLVHPSAIRLALGELTIFSRRVHRLNAFAAPLVQTNGDRQAEITWLGELLVRIRADMNRDEVIFLESVAEGTAMFDLVSGVAAVPGGFHAFQNGKLYRHRFAKVTGSFDTYLAQLGARTRADLRSNRKRFIAHVGQKYRTRCFSADFEVPAFLDVAMELSRKTYQYRLLGSGLRDRQALERCYLSASRLGWFRSYVLYADEEAIAFQVGYVYRGRFHAQEIGYDPEWARHHVGIFLHGEIISDLAATGAIAEFDFGNGDNLHKERLSTASRLEGYFYLIPSDVKGSLMVACMRATNKASGAIGDVLESLGVRRKTRDLLRKLGAMK